MLLQCLQAANHRFNLATGNVIFLHQLLSLVLPVFLLRPQGGIFSLQLFTTCDKFFDFFDQGV